MGWGTPSCPGLGGYPDPVFARGVLHSCPGQGGYPSPVLDRGYPQPGMGTPAWDWGTSPWPGLGYSPPRLGYPPQKGNGTRDLRKNLGLGYLPPGKGPGTSDLGKNLGLGYPPPLLWTDGRTPVKTLPSHCTTYAGGYEMPPIGALGGSRTSLNLTAPGLGVYFKLLMLSPNLPKTEIPDVWWWLGGGGSNFLC